MPTENELKFVLRIDDSIQYEAMEASYESLKIEQGYLKPAKTKDKLCVRVRKQLNREGVTRRFLHVKMNGRGLSKDQVRRIEIETEIDERDFADFWEKAKGKLVKVRYLIKSATHNFHEDHEGNLWTEKWEVDFFKTGDNQTYFSVAEVEIPECEKEPLFEIPELIRKNTVFRVPLGDSRFSNSRLGDVGYATKLYQSLFNK